MLSPLADRKGSNSSQITLHWVYQILEFLISAPVFYSVVVLPLFSILQILLLEFLEEIDILHLLLYMTGQLEKHFPQINL